ncbi:hypothetical protein O181_045720 [Austropuccinia psidii MF-1]|uniref:Uncharacterized protein n=1 Tax=Austropuccinia psidii MF-1 TaxID=1389203 RepID=A0A9Q3HLG9_9BASI|nr:hypothetical protein [Austropuccinia psidii MF-1]
MSKEGKIILTSYANLFIGSQILLQDSKPLEPLIPIHLNSLNRILPGLGAWDLTIQGGGTVTTMGKNPPIDVYQCSSLTQLMENCPMGNTHPSWPYPSPLALLANSPPHQTPGQSHCFWALLAISRASGLPCLIRGFRG